jgi:enoyl-[acyl-carrier protein] reductase II
MTYSFEGNRVTRHTGTEYPIFQAPIGLISRSEMVGAVSAAGGVGLLETMFLPIPELQAEFDKVRARSNRPFGVHFLVSFLASQPEREKAILEWALDGKTKFVTTGYGDPTRYAQRIKDAGLTTYHHAETLDEALRAEDAGVDGVVLAGAEKGGGHGANNLHSFALLQQVRRRIGIPIVASGGIVDGYGMAAAFALGAEGVWMGTRFIASAECPWHDNYKQAIVDSEHVVGIETTRGDIPNVRAVSTPFAEAVARGEAGDRTKPYAGDAMANFYQGRTDLALVGAGESAVLIHEVKPAADIVKETVAEFWSEIDRLAQLRQPMAGAVAG